MPDPLRVAVLGRLAIDRALMPDASRRVLQAADIIGIRAIVVHAISDEAKAFYLALGLEVSPLQPMTLMATLADLQAAL